MSSLPAVFLIAVILRSSRWCFSIHCLHSGHRYNLNFSFQSTYYNGNFNILLNYVKFDKCTCITIQWIMVLNNPDFGVNLNNRAVLLHFPSALPVVHYHDKWVVNPAKGSMLKNFPTVQAKFQANLDKIPMTSPALFNFPYLEWGIMGNVGQDQVVFYGCL